MISTRLNAQAMCTVDPAKAIRRIVLRSCRGSKLGAMEHLIDRARKGESARGSTECDGRWCFGSDDAADARGLEVDRAIDEEERPAFRFDVNAADVLAERAKAQK